MPDPTFGLIGGGVASGIGALFGGGAERAAAQEQARLTREALNLQRDIYGRTREDLRPYLEAGTQVGLPGLLSLVSPEGRSQFLNQYYESPEFQTLEQQGRGSVLAQAAATGELGGSATGNQLRRIAPTLGLQALSQQQQRFGQLAGIGQGAATQTGQFGAQFGQSAAGLLQNIGALQGQARGAIPGAFGSAFGQAGGFALGRGLEGLF